MFIELFIMSFLRPICSSQACLVPRFDQYPRQFLQLFAHTRPSLIFSSVFTRTCKCRFRAKRAALSNSNLCARGYTSSGLGSVHVVQTQTARNRCGNAGKLMGVYFVSLIVVLYIKSRDERGIVLLWSWWKD